MKKIIFLFVVLFTIGIVNAGFCQIKEGSFEISPFVGGYMFEGKQDFDHTLIGGLRLGYNFTKHFGAEMLVNYGGSHYTKFVPKVDMGLYNLRAEALYHFIPDSRFVPFVAAGIGGQRNDYESAKNDNLRAVVDYGVGFKFFLTDDVALRADVRHVLASGSIYNNLEYTLGLSFLFGGAKPAPAPVAQPVAPPPAPKPAPRAPIAAPLGLSAVAASTSQIDTRWNCVQGATEYRVYRENAYAFPSTDCAEADKGLDADTRYCYQVAAIDDEGKESALSNEACAKTQAPSAPPAPSAPVQELKKTAAAAPSVVEQQILEKGRATIDIKFDTDKAIVKPKYKQELGKFADVMKKHPELNLIIEGHTDNVGKDAYNQKLSEKRAKSVRAYLIKNFGIAEDRLTAKGYGEEKPIDSNKTAAGRAKNRRVEAAADYVIKK